VPPHGLQTRVMEQSVVSEDNAVTKVRYRTCQEDHDYRQEQTPAKLGVTQAHTGPVKKSRGSHGGHNGTLGTPLAWAKIKGGSCDGSTNPQ
jgi:hypothetical protein